MIRQKSQNLTFFRQFLRFWHRADCDLHHRSMWGASFCKEHDAYVIELGVALWNRRRHESFAGSFLLSEAIICIILALNYTQEPSIKHFDVLKKADSEAVSSSSKSKLLRRLQWSWCSLLSDAKAIEVNENAQLGIVHPNRQETVKRFRHQTLSSAVVVLTHSMFSDLLFGFFLFKKIQFLQKKFVKRYFFWRQLFLSKV